MKIAVVGLGYVGTAMAALLAQQHQVVALDVDANRVEAINSGISPIFDPQISEFLRDKSLRLRATTNANDAYAGADFIVIATPTNYDSDLDFFDTSSVESVIEEASQLSPGSTVVVKSTVPVGFTKRLVSEYSGMRILFSPEFLREGSALQDNLFPSRIIVSDRHPEAETFAEILSACSQDPSTPVLVTGSTEAEAIKLFSNTYLALRVAFFNELDTFAATHGLDTREIISGVSHDPRIGSFYNNPSFGYGGYCLPKDTKQLLANYRDVPQNLIQAVVDSNATRIEFVARHIIDRNPHVVGIHRLAMKAGSDNFRESSIQEVTRHLRAEGIEVILYEPVIQESEYNRIEVVNDLGEFKKRSDVIVANRITAELADVMQKVYSRDLFGAN